MITILLSAFVELSCLLLHYTTAHTTAYEVSAIISLDNKEIDQTKWSLPSNRAWEREIKIDLHQSRELEISIRARDGDLTALAGLLYLRLEDYFDTNSVTFCLPLEPQGILLAEITYEIPRTERRQPKLKRGRRIFRRTLSLLCCRFRNLHMYVYPHVHVHVLSLHVLVCSVHVHV